MYTKCNDLNAQAAIVSRPRWGKDYPAGYTFAGPLFDSSSLWPSCCNYTGLGATADQIKEWGYTGVTSVASVDDKIAACGRGQTGDCTCSSAGRTSTSS